MKKFLKIAVLGLLGLGVLYGVFIVGMSAQRVKTNYDSLRIYALHKKHEFFAPKHDHSGQCTALDYHSYDGEILNSDLFDNSKLFAPDIRLYQTTPLNEEGIVTHLRHGENLFHPFLMGQRTTHSVKFYELFGKEKYLEDAKRHAQVLLDNRTEINGAYFFAYHFEFPLHGYEDEKVMPPWYSALSQGAILGGFSRLYHVTKDPKYKDAAEKTFLSLQNRRIGDTDTPHSWMQCVNQRGLVWLEEYPTDTPNFVLNGMIVAMVGVYDYYRLVGSDVAEALLRGTLETIKQQIYEFRIEGGISRYCKGHPKGNYKGYHDMHVHQLMMLNEMTGDDFFMQAAEDFASDLDKTVKDYQW